MFSQYGIRNVTVMDIAEKIHVSKKTIYQHFRNKEDIIMSLIGISLTRNDEVRKKIEAKALFPSNELIEIFEHFYRLFSKVNPSVFYDMRKHHEMSWIRYKTQKMHLMLLMFENNLKKGITQGCYRSNINCEIMSRLAIEEIAMFIKSESPKTNDFSLAKDTLIRHFVYGITTLKGRKHFTSQ